MNCPYCGCKCIENIYGDEVCPIDGIVKYHFMDDYKKFDNDYENKLSYIG